MAIFSQMHAKILSGLALERGYLCIEPVSYLLPAVFLIEDTLAQLYLYYPLIGLVILSGVGNADLA